MKIVNKPVAVCVKSDGGLKDKLDKAEELIAELKQYIQYFHSWVF